MKTRAILSDAGGILFDDHPAKLKEYSFLSQNLDQAPSYREFMDAYHSHKQKAQTNPDYSKNQAFLEYLTSLGLERLREDFLKYSRDYDLKLKEQASELVFPGTRETLRELKNKSIEFIVLTDATRSARQSIEDFYQPAGLSEYFTDIIASSDIGVKKPNPLFFQYALDKHKLKVEESFFVAHDWDEIKGGHDFGLKVVAYRYKTEIESKIDELEHCRKIKEFKDLLMVIE